MLRLLTLLALVAWLAAVTESRPPAERGQRTVTRTAAAATGGPSSAAATDAANAAQPAPWRRVDYFIAPCTFYDRAAPFREIVLRNDGSLSESAYRCVGRNYNRADVVDWRHGPEAADFGPVATLPTVWGPAENGLWPFGITPEPQKCRLSADLPRSDEQERQDGMRGAGWQTAGQHVFVPDRTAASEYRYGISNTRAADGVGFDTGGLCMRMIPSWQPDWWNRNDISAPATPAIVDLLRRRADVPLPPVAIARGRTNSNQIGFAAFVDGTIVPIPVGNRAPESDDTEGVRLPAGLVPTAMAVTPYNEFLLVTVWDTEAVRGRLAVIALRTRQMAVGAPWQTPNTRYFWGLPGAWTVTDMKLLGLVDLPFATPMAIDTSNNVISGNPRGYTDNDGALGDLSRQATRDVWNAVPWDTAYGDHYWRQTARYGYAVVASRVENKVAFVDLGPLYRYFRTMYLTTAANYQQTLQQGEGASQWPHTFAHAPAQRPTVATVLDVPAPTAVRAGIRTNSIFGITRSDEFTEATGDNSFRSLARRTAYVATMDGTVRMYDISRLSQPFDGTPSVPAAPRGTFKAGRNPVAFAHNTSLSTAPDDLFVISRGDRSITYAFPDGAIQGVLRDQRLVDPVGGALTMNQAGFGGRGVGRAVFSVVMTVTDFHGRQLVDYGVDAKRGHAEQYPFVAPSGPVSFLFGSRVATPGQPFQITFDEVI